MHLINDFEHFRIHAFWSRDIRSLANEITRLHAKSYATQHDLVLNFINNTFYRGDGEFNKQFRKKGGKYYDLKIPSEESKKRFKILELKLRTSQLKYLRRVLKKLGKIFSLSDFLFYCFFLRRALKDKSKELKANVCIYYLVIIKLSKKAQTTPLDELVREIKMGTEDFTKKVMKKSGVDEEKEELLGVENMIKVDDLERKNRLLKAKVEEQHEKLEEKDKKLEEIDKKLEEKDKLIKRLKEKLNHD